MNLALTFLILKKCLRRLVPILVSSLIFDGFIFERIEQTKKAKARTAVSCSWKIHRMLDFK